MQNQTFEEWYDINESQLIRKFEKKRPEKFMIEEDYMTIYNDCEFQAFAQKQYNRL